MNKGRNSAFTAVFIPVGPGSSTPTAGDLPVGHEGSAQRALAGSFCVQKYDTIGWSPMVKEF